MKINKIGLLGTTLCVLLIFGCIWLTGDLVELANKELYGQFKKLYGLLILQLIITIMFVFGLKMLNKFKVIKK